MKSLLTLTLLLLALPSAADYKCKDERGITHIGDIPPPGCANVVMYEITKSGQVLRRIEPTLTPEQLKAKLAQDARKARESRAATETRRKDRALLATYSSEADIDRSRDLNLKPIEGRIKSAQDRTAAIEKQRRKLESELEFYKSGKSAKGAKKDAAPAREVPPQLTADLERTQNEKAAIAKSIAGYEAEMQQVRERYEAERKRWVELKQLQRDGKLDLSEPKQIESASKAGAAKPAARK